MWKALWTRFLAPAIAFALFAGAVKTLHGELKQFTYQDIMQHVREVPTHLVLGAFAFSALSYLVMTGFDYLGLLYVGKKLPYRLTAIVSFISYAFTNNMSFAALTGGMIRYRLYSAYGLSAGDISKVVAFCGLTFWVGVFNTGGLAMTLKPLPLPASYGLPFASTLPLGILLLALGVAYFAAAAFTRDVWVIRGWAIRIPGTGIAAWQNVLALADWLAAGAVFHLLLPESTHVPFLLTLGIFVVSQVLGLVSSVPGGLGVFEASILFLLKPYATTPQLLGSLFLYRLAYYFAPMLVAILSLGAFEAYAKKAKLAKGAALLDRWLFPVMPLVYAVMCFLGGIVLLFSGSTPGMENRLLRLSDILPLPLLESSHFFASLTGALLLILAQGLYRRIDAAYHGALALLAAGILFSLLKGLDYEEAAFLGILLLAILPAHRHFHRKASMFGAPFTVAWFFAVGLVFAAAAWLGFFCYRHVDYAHELWWKFSVDGDASRFLRGTVGAASLILMVGLSRLLSPARPAPGLPDTASLDKAERIIAASPRSGAGLALLADKSLLFSESGKSFIMYGVAGRSWVALGDPVGEQTEFPELVWKFRDLCDDYAAWPVFYQAEPALLTLYVDIGLTMLKLGEEARIDLRAFSLEGNPAKKLRYTVRRSEKDGLAFEWVPKGGVAPLLPELKRISDEWLETKHTREKGFSLGYFDPAYIANFPAGLIRKDGRILAFATVLTGAGKAELSIDLMRHVRSDAKDVMELLFIRLMLWGKAEGYAWFNLGMAPLAGLDNRPLAPLWNRVGSAIFRHGEHFYNFQGLRRWKDQFNPVWEPRYLASPSGLALPRILANISTLISGGVKGLLGK
jgi:phosphatidylglycerol lysyltransferase